MLPLTNFSLKSRAGFLYPRSSNPWHGINEFNDGTFPIFGWDITPYRKKLSNTNSVSAKVVNESCELIDVISTSPSEQLKYIRNALSLNMSQVAELIGVTRPTAYAWFDGKEGGRDETSEKIRYLASVARTIENKNIPRVDLLMRRKIFNSKSLFDLIKEERDINRELDVLETIGIREDENRKNRTPQTKNLTKMMDAVDELSMPIYFERSSDL